eukprot:scaffold40529_cov71-Cyclotella_meneghiniana.AAC.1
MATPSKCRCKHHIKPPTANEQCMYSVSIRGDVNGTDDFISSQSAHEEIFCWSCSNNILSISRTRLEAAIETRRIERADFEKRILATRLVGKNIQEEEELTLSNTDALPDPSQIHHRVYQLRQRLDKLRSISNELAIRVTSKTMDNDERQGKLEISSAKIDLARERLESMRQNLLVGSSSQTAQEFGEEKKEVHTSQNHPFVTNMGGGLIDALVSGTRQIQKTRFYFALRVFEMHRIDVGEEYSHLANNETNRNATASGIGKIGGLPLPHAGPALYGVLPPGMLASSLRLVACVTNLLASCLGVVLPHPILIGSQECERCGKVYNYGGDVTTCGGMNSETTDEDFDGNLCSVCEREDVKVSNEYSVTKSQKVAPSLLEKIPSKTRLFSFVGTSARKAVALATGSPASYPSNTTSNYTGPSVMSDTNQKKSMQPRIVSSPVIARRVNYATFAVLLENNAPEAASYILNPPRWKEDKKKSYNEDHQDSVCQHFTNREDFHRADEKFSIGLQLLQNDVIALCFRAGVDASTLWPAESMLLNLYSLLCHCVKVYQS